MRERRQGRRWPAPKLYRTHAGGSITISKPHPEPPPHKYFGDRNRVPPEACRECGAHFMSPAHQEWEKRNGTAKG